MAVIEELEVRGFSRKDMFIVDETVYNLRCGGFLPELSCGGDRFHGVAVYGLDQDIYWDEEWHYTTSLPSWSAFTRFLMRGTGTQNLGERSYLPVPLLLEVDFWINLPMVTSGEVIAVMGALANGTIFNVSNNKRFLINRVHGSVAMAEIAAIPEVQETWIFTLMTLERYQIVGGGMFNHRYTRSEPLLWLGVNASAMDYMMFKRINWARHEEELRVFNGLPEFFGYCRELNVGDHEEGRVVRVGGW